ncbi:MAG: cell division protein FtsA [Rhodospirillales bacterium]|nr:cell division protein FtsA [Rhodospirillales bacterium]
MRSGRLAALDVGTTKIACLIAEPAMEGDLRIVGFGHHESYGVRRGNIVDLDAAETAIRATVEAAERMAGENIREVVVNVTAGVPRSRLIPHEVAIAGHEIGDVDLRRILDSSAILHEIPEDHDVLHAVPVGYSVDSTRGVRDPRGMFGQRLGVNLHVISAASGPVRNLATCIYRCHLDIAKKVVSPYAAALGSLNGDEADLGVTVIDMGGGTTTFAVFFDGEVIHTDTISVGGAQVTSDIARGLSTPLVQAERIKTLFGSCVPSPTDNRFVIEVPPMGEEPTGEPSQIPRTNLVGIIAPRMEEIFEMVRSGLEDAGFDRLSGRLVVLTGGACQLPGAAELAGKILDRQVRIGRPRPMPGLPDAASGPAFATAMGLLRYAAENTAEADTTLYQPAEKLPGRFGRLGHWLRENF